MEYKKITAADGQVHLAVSLTDYALISNPLLNKGMAFNQRERHEFGLYGLIPPHEATIDEQIQRSYSAFKNKSSDIEKYLYLRDLQDSNETLFYRLFYEHIEEILPVFYTPTVGLACQKFSHIYRRSRGVFVAYPYRQHIKEILANPRYDQVKVIVVSDGERILGLGDQGAGGMGIPIGKLALYTACAGIYPASTLPILLDVGTDNETLLNDPLYIGWNHRRIRGQEYDDFIEMFISEVKERFPHVLLQWEDFAQQNASKLLARYQQRLCTFNDDIQGTAVAATGTLLAAINVAGTRLRDQRIVVVGAGSAGCGISRLMMQAMIEDGLTPEEARHHFYLVDRAGLLIKGMPDTFPFQQDFLQDRQAIANWKINNPDLITLEEVVKNAHPTLLIGTSSQPKLFSENIVREMAKHVARPMIFPLSNPTSLIEAVPSDLLAWTNGRAIISTGSPFPDIEIDGKLRRIDQTNNSYIFPGLGLGLIVVGAKHVSESILMAAARALADASPSKNNPKDNLLPSLTKIHKVSLEIARAVALEAIREGLATRIYSSDELTQVIKSKMWFPDYLPYFKMESS